MGQFLAIGQVASGLFGAAANSAAYSQAAQNEREQANYNAQISRYNGEVAAQETQYNSEDQQQQLRQQKEVVRRNSDHRQVGMALESEQKAGTAKAALAASGAESATAPGAVVEQRYRDYLAIQEEQAASAYQTSIFEHKAGQVGTQATKTAYNQRQQALFQGANALGQGYAKAAEYDSKAASTLTFGVLNAGLQGFSILGGGIGGSTSGAAGSSSGPFDFASYSGGNAASPKGAFDYPYVQPDIFGRTSNTTFGY
jgi:hypothetical protein